MSNVVAFPRRKPAPEPEFMAEWRAIFQAEISRADLETALRRADAYRAFLIRQRDEHDPVLDAVREEMGAKHA
jgi:hypothetical protein